MKLINFDQNLLFDLTILFKWTLNFKLTLVLIVCLCFLIVLEVLIDVAACGICGSDLHWHLEGKLGPFLARDNAIMGHEASGTVIKVGSKVTHLKPGDRVCVEPCEPCWTCDLCRIGSNNLCHDADNMCCGGLRKGFFRSTNVWPAILCHKWVTWLIGRLN